MQATYNMADFLSSVGGTNEDMDFPPPHLKAVNLKSGCARNVQLCIFCNCKQDHRIGHEAYCNAYSRGQVLTVLTVWERLRLQASEPWGGGTVGCKYAARESYEGLQD